MSREELYLDEEINQAITSDDILGKDVLDSEGERIGVVEQVHIHPKTIEVTGISVDKGVLSKGLFIGKGYIDKITPYAVFLKIRPSVKIKGMQVFDTRGEEIGVVTKVTLDGHKDKIAHIVVKSGMFGKELVLGASVIKSIGHNVLLNVRKKELKDNYS